MYDTQVKIVFRDKRLRVALEIAFTSFSYIYYAPPSSTVRHPPSLPTEPRSRLKWTVFAFRFQ